MRSKTVIIIEWRITGRVEAFTNLGKLYSIYSNDQLGVSRSTLDRKDLYDGYDNDVISLKKLFIR